jgi:hypothetical protein
VVSQLIWIKSLNLAIGFHVFRVSRRIAEDVMTALKTLTIAAGLLAAGTSLAMAEYYPGYGYGYGGLYDYAAPGYGYAGYGGAPLYDYAGSGYGAPAAAGTTIIIVTPGSAYTAPRPLYSYAPGYWGGYGGWGGYGRWGVGYGW